MYRVPTRDVNMYCIPISGKRGAFISGDVTFSSGKFCIESPMGVLEKMTEVHRSSEHGDIIPVLDVDSFSKKFLNPDVVKEIRVKGRRVWLISYIRSTEDVVDVMCGAFDRLCIPLHTVDNIEVLSEALELSDSILPTIFVSDGKYIGDGDINKMVGIIRELGYYEYSLFDVDGCTLEYCLSLTDDIN